MANAFPTPNEATVQEAVGGFLKFILPPGTEVIEGQDTAVPEPRGTRFVVATPIHRPRMATNLVLYADVELFGSISGTNLTVESVQFGVILPGSRLWGVEGDIADGTTIVKQLTGVEGERGIYELSQPQSAALQTMACGNMSMWTDYDLTLQLDVHGLNPRDSTDMAGTIESLLRDSVATDYFDSLGLGVSPLFMDDPIQAPFTNAEQAWESKWTIDAHFQVNQRITLPMQFATKVVVQIRLPVS
jgi:hypothetical protein